MLREQQRGPGKKENVHDCECKSSADGAVKASIDLEEDCIRDLSAALNALLADAFALYMKTKNFHWHLSGPHFRDHHLLLDEQGEQIFAMTDPIAERARKLGGTTLRSIGQISRLQRILDNDADYVTPGGMLAELRDDNRQLVTAMRQLHNLCESAADVATASELIASLPIFAAATLALLPYAKGSVIGVAWDFSVIWELPPGSDHGA